jgi:hypothetical protein
MGSAYAGDLYAEDSNGVGDARLLVVLAQTDEHVDGLIVTPANRVAPVGERVLIPKAELDDRWCWLETVDNR